MISSGQVDFFAKFFLLHRPCNEMNLALSLNELFSIFFRPHVYAFVFRKLPISFKNIDHIFSTLNTTRKLSVK